MVKNLLTLLTFSLLSWSLAAQCPPSGSASLNSQADVDAYVAMYPNCTTLTDLNIRPITGGAPTDITDISGLSSLQNVDRQLTVTENPLLTSLAGLDNLASASLNGSSDGTFIRDNPSLTSLAALSSLVNCERLDIERNNALTSLDGLNNLANITASITIAENALLTDISGISNVNVGASINIMDNPLLSDCAVASVCDHLDNGGSATISGNTGDCATQQDVETACAGPACPTGDVVLFDQEQLDSFLILYPTCTTIDGNLVIGDEFGASDITDLSALSGITTINGGCYFYNTQLTNFAGVGNVSTLSGECVISGNSQITNLNGLGAPPGFTITNLTITNNALLTEITAFSMLTSISGDLTISNNGSLTSFNGLQNLVSIGGGCFYNNNTALTSIELISLTSVGGALEITGNTSLSNCATASVCNGIDAGGSITISGNAAGCASLAEVEAECGGDVCPMGDLILATQADVDAFVAGFPDCTEVDGNLVIGVEGGSSDITDISGLSGITAVYGGCYFYNTQLTSFNGVGSITTVSGECVIVGNNLITNLNGLGAPPGFTITNLIITDNVLLTEITAFSMLTTISGDLRIERNGSLTSFNGLQNLTTIGGGCFYYNNTSLVSIELISLTSVGGGLEIVGNTSLSNCAITSVCDAVNGGGSITISGNAAGCASLAEVEAECALVGGGDCPEGDVTFTSQAEVDAFVAAYPNCTMITGDFRIGIGNSPTDITNLTGLSSITTVQGMLTFAFNSSLTSLTGCGGLTTVQGGVCVFNNDALVSLAGLDSLNFVGAQVHIFGNDAMSSLDGLGSLQTIGGDLRVRFNDALASLSGLDALSTIGSYLAIYGNGSLTNLNALSSVSSIGSFLAIRSNTTLTDISGLINIDANSIDRLYITGNTSLTTCNIQVVCDYLSVESNLAAFVQNGIDCNSRAEVEAACDDDGFVNDQGNNLGIQGAGGDYSSFTPAEIQVYPNPTNGLVQIRNVEAQRVTIFNPQGQRMAQFDTPGTQLDMSTLPAGVYYLSFETTAGPQTKRVVKIN